MAYNYNGYQTRTVGTTVEDPTLPGGQKLVPAPDGSVVSGAGQTWDSLNDHPYWGDTVPSSGMSKDDYIKRQYAMNEGAFTNPYMGSDMELLRSGRLDSQSKARNAYESYLKNRQNQYNLADRLMAVYEGRGPSMAQQAYLKNVGDNINASLAMGNSGRGSRAAAMRMAQYNVGNANMQAANQASQIREQERMNALSALQGQYASIANQDIEMRKASDQMVQYYMSQGLSQTQAQWAANMELQKMRLGEDIENKKTLKGVSGQGSWWDRNGGAVISGAATVGAAGIAAMSDKRVKKNISAPKKKDLEEFLSSISGYRYEYKDQKHGRGKQFSPMAQDLEKSSIGRAMVIDTPEGKMVDYGKGFGALLAAQAELYKEVQDLRAAK